jgi:hypothetical protein
MVSREIGGGVQKKIFLLVLLLAALALPAASTQAQAVNVNANVNEEEQACVTLVKYSNRKCSGGPVGENTFTTMTVPGSPCKHTARMGHNSAKDQHCVLDQDIFKQSVYVNDNKCHVSIWEKAISPMHLVYSKNHCVYGYKLGSCTAGPCSTEEGTEETDPALGSFPQLRTKAEVA